MRDGCTWFSVERLQWRRRKSLSHDWHLSIKPNHWQAPIVLIRVWPHHLKDPRETDMCDISLGNLSGVFCEKTTVCERVQSPSGRGRVTYRVGMKSQRGIRVISKIKKRHFHTSCNFHGLTWKDGDTLQMRLATRYTLHIDDVNHRPLRPHSMFGPGWRPPVCKETMKRPAEVD